MSTNKKLFSAGSDEWLQARLNYVTATEIGSLFKCGSKGIDKLMEEKLDPPEKIKNEFMLIGNILEPAVIESFRIRMGINVQPAHPNKTLFMWHDKARLSATPDAKLDYKDKFYNVECKTTGSKCPDRAEQNFLKWENGVPVHYAMQVHAQMAVTGARHSLIGCMGYIYPLPFVVYEITYNQEIEELMLEEVNKFWDCLENDKLFEHDSDKIKRIKKLIDDNQELVYIYK